MTLEPTVLQGGRGRGEGGTENHTTGVITIEIQEVGVDSFIRGDELKKGWHAGTIK